MFFSPRLCNHKLRAVNDAYFYYHMFYPCFFYLFSITPCVFWENTLTFTSTSASLMWRPLQILIHIFYFFVFINPCFVIHLHKLVRWVMRCLLMSILSSISWESLIFQELFHHHVPQQFQLSLAFNSECHFRTHFFLKKSSLLKCRSIVFSKSS